MDSENLQKSVEKIKATSLFNNIHNMSPPQNLRQTQENPVAIIEALKSNRLIQELQIELQGIMFDYFQKKWVRYRRPVMNELGIGNFIQAIKHISESIEFSYFDKEEIPKYALMFFKANYPYFTVYHKEYDLDRKDFNLIKTLLLTYIISSLMKSKGAGHRNVVRGTYSEDLLGRLTKQEEERRGGILSGLGRLNPFNRKPV